MTIYVTRQDLETRFGQAETAQAAWRESLDADDVIAAACAGAAELVDAHLASRYRLPLEPLPLMVKEIALDVAWYKLWRGPIPDDVTARYKDAQRLLDKIASGALELQADGIAPAESVSGSPGVAFEGRERMFNDSSMGDY
ncbi:putative Mu-like prophage protein gp36 [Magnetospirillum sp. XM-1]|uniref:gp436 family protein n=1 Tax=Magnetospirillum sp. XM-1 TaxID=1663591 RepID=UPI00073DD8A1|nr:DUF1320 domain-containing protein [Magnetospirillum sp. XM-1]CUW41137.1 putative Mu-like prophage protein gp36 [Magnetospirillum sp. XM-1]